MDIIHVGPPLDEMEFSMELIVDLQGCEPEILTDPDALTLFCGEAVAVLGMKPFGDPQLWHFGHNNPVTSGYTSEVVAVASPGPGGVTRSRQLIETSSIVGHYSEVQRRARLNLHSCQVFDPDRAVKFCAEFFDGQVAQAVLVVC